VLDDDVAEEEELLTLSLSLAPGSPPGALIRTEDATADVVILDDDQAPRLVVQTTAAGGIQLICYGREGATFNLQSSSDLQTWLAVPGNPVTTIGMSKGVTITLGEDSTLGRFYRIRSP
jgi:hypothetical protein